MNSAANVLAADSVMVPLERILTDAGQRGHSLSFWVQSPHGT
jgi:hypothetical protein